MVSRVGSAAYVGYRVFGVDGVFSLRLYFCEATGEVVLTRKEEDAT